MEKSLEDDMDVSPLDPESIQYYVDEVKKNIEQKLERRAEAQFLHSSLRSSERLKAIEQSERVIHPGDSHTYDAINEAFEDDEMCKISYDELKELISYLGTKLKQPPVSTQNRKSYPNNEELGGHTGSVTDADQWDWLLHMLSDPLTAKTLLMHNRVTKAYARCRSQMRDRPREEWPQLPGLSIDSLTLVQNHLMIDFLQRPVLTESVVLTHASTLYRVLTRPIFRQLLAAVDGLANTWLTNIHDTDMVNYRNLKNLSSLNFDSATETMEDQTIEMSVVPGCYSVLAYDDNGRYSYSPQGVRLKYVVLQKFEDDFLGATVRIEERSVIVSRIVHGGVAQKSNLLHVGDELLAANGIELLGKDLTTVCDIMAEMHGKIVLLVAPSSTPFSSTNTSGTIIHLRAMFTYDPEDDSYLACKQLGLPFVKGDVLHITGRGDPNWWQAYRRDSDTHGIVGAAGTLAGLIPSPIYQLERAIFRIRHWISTNSELVEFEEMPEDAVELLGSTTLSPVASEQPAKPGFFKRVYKQVLPRRHSSVNEKTLNRLSSCDRSDEVVGNDDDTFQFSVQHNVLSSVYSVRTSNQYVMKGSTPQIANDSVHASMAAGPFWSQHGFEVGPSKSNRRSSKKAKITLVQLQQILPEPNRDWQERADDPVAWLDKVVATGYMPHPSLWTYEPVAQYLPQPLRRRPLVFVGPIHVGRHQVMQALINVDPDRFFAAAIYTTNSCLKDGAATPYIYISEEEFETKRKGKQFIEWGVLSKARYGTTTDTVTSIIKDGKVCCLTLRPDSLRAMRSTGMKPYVIFISPPDRVDDLRRIQENLGLDYNCEDDELRACIETSRKMEVRFGHWFDVAIIPDTMESTVGELLTLATRLDREPSWVSRYWLMRTSFQ